MPLNKQVMLVLLSRSMRTFPLGMLGIIIPIYISLFGSAVLGTFISLSIISSAVMLVVLTFYGHRFSMVHVIVILTLFFTASLFILSLSAVIPLVLFAGAISLTNWAPGGGSGTGGGAYNMAVNLVLSERTERNSRTLAISLVAVIGSLSYAAGAFFLDALDIPKPTRPPISSSFFVLPNLSLGTPSSILVLGAIISIASIVFLLPLIRGAAKGDQGKNKSANDDLQHDQQRRQQQQGVQQRIEEKAEGVVEKEEQESNRNLGNGAPGLSIPTHNLRQIFSHAVAFIGAESSNGFGNGLYAQLAPLWFYLRYGISVGEVGEIFAGAGVITASLVLLSPRIERRMGQINAVAIARAGNGLLLFITAFSPSLPFALIFYYSSLILARIAVPIQQSFLFSRIDQAEWTQAASMTAVSNLLATSIGSLIGSFLLLDVNVDLPLVLCFPFILASALVYKRILGKKQV